MKLNKIFLLIIGIEILSYSSLSNAEIYRYVDKNGNVNFTNMPKRGAQRLNIPSAPKKVTSTATANNSNNRKNSGSMPSSSKAPSSATGKIPKGELTNASPSTFPKENDANRNRKESLRAKILNQELYNEESALKQAKSDLTKNPNDSKLKKQVLLHQKNIEAIHKELKGR